MKSNLFLTPYFITNNCDMWLVLNKKYTEEEAVHIFYITIGAEDYEGCRICNIEKDYVREYNSKVDEEGEEGDYLMEMKEKILLKFGVQN